MNAGVALAAMNGHGSFVNAVDFAPDGRTALSASWDTSIALWDLTTGTEIRSLDGHDQSVNDVAFSPDGRIAASASWDGTIRLWQPSSGKPDRCDGRP